jgi:hypothetical protein
MDMVPSLHIYSYVFPRGRREREGRGVCGGVLDRFCLPDDFDTVHSIFDRMFFTIYVCGRRGMFFIICVSVLGCFSPFLTVLG